MSNIRTNFENIVYEDGFSTMYHHVRNHGVLSIDTAISKCEEYNFILLKNILILLSSNTKDSCVKTDLSPLMKKEVISYIIDSIKCINSRSLKEGEWSHDHKVFKFNPNDIDKGYADMLDHGLLLNGLAHLLRKRENEKYDFIKSYYEVSLRLDAFRKERNIPIPDKKSEPINSYSYHQIIKYIKDKNEARRMKGDIVFFIKVSQSCAKPFVTLDDKDNYCLVVASLNKQYQEESWDIVVVGHDYESYRISNCSKESKDRMLHYLQNMDSEINEKQLHLIGLRIR